MIVRLEERYREDGRITMGRCFLVNGYGYLVALTGVTPMAMGYPHSPWKQLGASTSIEFRFFASLAGSEPGK